MTELAKQGRWPTLPSADERVLLQLERVISLPSTTATSWTENITQLGHWGYHGHDQFKEVEVTRDLEPEEKIRIKRNLMAKLYANLAGNPAAEQIARALIAADGTNSTQA